MPFIEGESRRAAEDLTAALHGAGHDVEAIWLPLDIDPDRTVERALAIRLTDVTLAGELLVAVRAPAHLLDHPRKVVWYEHDGSDPERSLALGEREAFAAAVRVLATSRADAELARRLGGAQTEVADAAAAAAAIAELIS